jgi:hypothetical protein
MMPLPPAMPSQPGLDSPSEGTRQPKTLGQTERGLQIMAYDQATEQANVDLSAFVGGEDDDIDSMFDDIFGGPSQAKEVPATTAAAPRSAPSFLSGPVAAGSREPAPPAAPPAASAAAGSCSGRSQRSWRCAGHALRRSTAETAARVIKRLLGDTGT